MIQSVEIKNLRGIREGKLENLTPLVVLVGPNGSGKSTVLDALLIGASPNTSEAIARAANRRRSVSSGARWLLWRGDVGSASEIVIRSNSFSYRRTRLGSDPSDSKDIFSITWIIQYGRIRGGSKGGFEEAMTDSYGGHVSFHGQGGYSPTGNAKDLEGVSEIRLIEAHASNLQIPLHQLFTKTVELGRRREAREILAEVVPGLSDIEILTDGEAPIVYLVFEDHAIPVALAGDGVQSLLQLSLELASRRGGVVMLEEPEVHLHPGAIWQSARAILAAIRRDIQVILTTHSLELIDALLAEAKDDEEINKLTVYGLRLDDGLLKSNRVVGTDVAFARTQIGDDLR